MNESLPTAPPLNSQEQTIFDDVTPAVPLGAPPSGAASSAPSTDTPAAAAAARSAAVLAPPFTWQGKPLYPFTPFRESWWRYIREAACLPSLSLVSRDPREFAQDAAIILWLCLHKVEEWGTLDEAGSDGDHTQFAWIDYRRSLPRFASVCAEWGDAEIGFEHQSAAAALAMDIHNRAHSTRAVNDVAPTSSRLGE